MCKDLTVRQAARDLRVQQAKRAARGFRTAASFIAIAYLRLGKLTHLPVSLFAPATAPSAGPTRHRV